MEFDLVYDKTYRDDLIQKTKLLWNFAGDMKYYLRTKDNSVSFDITYPVVINNMALCLEEYEENFRICLLNINQENYHVDDPKGQSWRQRITSNLVVQGSSLVNFLFKADKHGTYYQTLVFQDMSLNYYRTRIVIDYLRPEDEKRMLAADHYIASQLNLISSVAEPTYWHSLPEPHKMLLERTYPRMTSEVLLSYDLVAADQLTPKNYRNVLKQLISVEETCRLAHISKFNCSKKVKLLRSYRLGSEDGSTAINKYAPEGQFLILLELEQDGTEDSAAGKLLLQSCDEVNVTVCSLDLTFRLRIEDRAHNCIGLRLYRDMLQRHWDSTQQILRAGIELDMKFSFIQNRIPFCQWQLAVDLLPDTRFVFPVANYAQVDSNTTGDMVLDNILNHQQKQAVALMLEPRQDYKPPVLIVGAFGTGKTFTIAHGIRRILETQPDAKIVLCTHSNSAADLYVKEYFDRWYTDTGNESFKPLRIYYPERVKSTVSVEVQKYCLFIDNGQFFRYPTDEDLRKPKIIVTTLVTSFSLLNLTIQPTHIVIDEAAQAFECEAIMPLTKATPKTLLILAGDNLQMRPEVYSHLAALRGFGISLLERLENLYDHNNMTKIILRTNYRSHPKIIDVMTTCLYGRSVLKNTKKIQDPDDGFFHFINVCGIEQKTHNSTGYYNSAEVEEIVGIAMQMKSFWQPEEFGKYGEGSIGVLTHYSEQVSAIRSALRKKGMHEVSVERIQNVQGKQFPVVIISTVITSRNNRLGALLNVRNYGFLTDIGLLNTAITRAKNVVTVVGDLLALITMGNCQRIWRYMLSTTDHIDGITQAKLFQAADNLRPLKTTPLNPEANPFFPCGKSKNNKPTGQVVCQVPVMFPVYVPVLVSSASKTTGMSTNTRKLDELRDEDDKSEKN